VLEQQVFLHRHLLCIAEPLLGGGRRGADLDMVLAVKLSSFSSTAETTIRVPGLISCTFRAGLALTLVSAVSILSADAVDARHPCRKAVNLVGKTASPVRDFRHSVTAKFAAIAAQADA
jgi:hypothetical protein